jgi:alpha,alpha-trehalose phosphorylase
MDHTFEGPDGTFSSAECEPDIGRVTLATDLAVGERLTMVKFLSYGWSSQRSLAAVRDQVIAAVAKAKYAGWDGLLEGQRAYLDDFWATADVELEGDTELQQAVRFALFHTLQAGARAEQRAIPAKGLTGPGYDGHTFWDTERYVLPVLTYTVPHATRDALLWRHSTLDLARDRAEQLGLKGAAFPWRTIRGHECSAYWPAGTAAFHINANVADAVVRYQAAVEDEVFELEAGLEVLVETARLWNSLGHHDAEGRFRIDGVTGPDEYSALADNNVFTNLLAQRNLLAAAEAVTRHPDEAAEFDAELEEAASWRDAARDMVVPWDEALGVHPQSEGFTEHQVWDFANTKPDQYPLLLNFPYFDLYRKQVVKQADLVLALHWRGDAFTDEEKARDFAYYEPLTVRDSSLSACTQAIVAAEVGHLELAYDYFGEAALMDLARPRAQHPRRRPYRLARRLLARRGCGLRRHAGPRRFSQLRPEASRPARAARLRHPLPRPAAQGRGEEARGDVHADRGRPARDLALRRSHRGLEAEARHPADRPDRFRRAGADSAARTRADGQAAGCEEAPSGQGKGRDEGRQLKRTP